MSKPGKFLAKHFMNKDVEIWTTTESEYLHYSDSDMFTWTIFCGTLVGYDTESGILTLQTPSKKRFYLNEFQVHLFFEPGTDIKEFSNSTLNGPKKIKI